MPCGNIDLLTLLGVWCGGACAAMKEFENALDELRLDTVHNRVGSRWIEMLVQGELGRQHGLQRVQLQRQTVLSEN